MIVGQFLLWARRAPPGHRAEALSALARAYLFSDMVPGDRAEAETAMTAMLDDPSPLVRRALAESLAAAAGAPRHIVLALAGDRADIAALVLARSPVLADADLVDGAALGDEPIQCAIASRARLSASVAAALAEIGTPAALAELARNPTAAIADFSLARMVERHGSEPTVREALLARPGLPVEIAQAIAAAVGESLRRFVTSCGWLSGERSDRVVREARDRTTLALSGTAESDDVGRLVQHLRRSGQLTPALILRAVLSGARPFAEAAFADLSGQPTRRVAAILHDARGGPFRALYGRAGLPDGLRPAFEAAFAASRESLASGEGAGGAQLSRRMVERALTAYEALEADEAGRLIALLRRFDMEAARDEARQAVDGIADRAALAVVMRHAPDELADMASSALTLAA